MLEFLKEYGISDNIIKMIEKENSRANIYNLSCNMEEVGKILDYFKSLNINCINDLLVYRIQIFFNCYEDILECFSKYNITSLVEKINEDFAIIDEIN